MVGTVELTEVQQKARAAIQTQLYDAADTNGQVDLVLAYYKQGLQDGMKAGVKQTMQAIKAQIDGIWEQLNKEKSSGTDDSTG